MRTKELLNGKFSPITDSWGFVEAPLEVVSAAYIDWRKSIYPPGGAQIESMEGDLAEMLCALNTLTAPPTAMLWVATSANWTAYFDNFINGTDAFPPVNYVSKILECSGIRIVSHVDSTDNDSTAGSGAKRKGGGYGGVSFELYGPNGDGPLRYERTVAAVNDGGRWSFASNGTPLSSENVEMYSKRKIKERFDSEQLEVICRSLGVNLFDEQFYGKRGLLARSGKALRSVRLSDRRLELGLEK